MVCALVCLITPLFDTTVCLSQHAVVFLAPIAEKVFIKCRKRQKKFAELKKLRIFAARLGNRNRFSDGD